MEGTTVYINIKPVALCKRTTHLTRSEDDARPGVNRKHETTTRKVWPTVSKVARRQRCGMGFGTGTFLAVSRQTLFPPVRSNQQTRQGTKEESTRGSETVERPDKRHGGRMPTVERHTQRYPRHPRQQPNPGPRHSPLLTNACNPNPNPYRAIYLQLYLTCALYGAHTK
jgi:hypothetical protein